MADSPVPIVTIKGTPVTLFPSPGYGSVTGATDKLSDGFVDCANYNAVSVTVYIPSGFTVSVAVEGSPDQQGIFLPLPDAQANQVALTASKVFDVTVGQRFIKVKLSSITVPGGNPVNNGIVVIVTPYDAAGQSNITITATASQNLAEVAGAAISLGAKTSADSLPVVLASDEATLPVSGTVTANIGTTPTGASSEAVQGAGVDGAAPVGRPVLVAGSDATDTRTLLTDTSGRLVTNVNTLPASATQSTIEQQVRAGNAFVWSPGKIAATTNARLLISNPTGSGKTLYVYTHALTADVAAVSVATLFQNPSVGLPTLGAVAAGIANQNGSSATTSVAEVGADTNATAMAVGTGSVITHEAVVGIGRTAYPAALYVIPANATLGIGIPIAAATGIIPELYWWEQ